MERRLREAEAQMTASSPPRKNTASLAIVEACLDGMFCNKDNDRCKSSFSLRRKAPTVPHKQFTHVTSSLCLMARTISDNYPMEQTLEN